MFEITDETKNYIIVFLLVLTLFSLLGINLLSEAGDGFEYATGGIIPYIKKLFGIIGWSTGSIINVSTDIVSDTARAGIDVAEGSIQSIGNYLQNASKGGMSIDLSKDQKLTNGDIRKKDTSTQSSPEELRKRMSEGKLSDQDKMTILEQHNKTKPEVKKDNSSNSIQNPISNKKLSSKWCLVGEYEGKRGCIEVDNNDICISQKIYNNLGECINRPTI